MFGCSLKMKIFRWRRLPARNTAKPAKLCSGLTSKNLNRKSSDENLLKLLALINRDTGRIMNKLETEVREHSTDWFDNAADNVFYNAQGQMYAYYVVLKAMAEDFKPQILNADQYENWTILTKTLEDGLALSPAVVRNGEADSVFAPNHLLILGGYAAKARYQINLIMTALQNSRLGNNHDN